MTTVFELDVRGDLACFSQPALSVERYSYPCPTPSAVRNLFDAIYLKPEQFRWQVRRIEILQPVAYVALRRNEVKEVIELGGKRDPLERVKKWMCGEPVIPIFADGDEVATGSKDKGRTQRQTMALRDVRYRLHAEIFPWPEHERNLKSLNDQFLRRIRHGKCFHQPYLGCREFVAYFRLADECDDRPSPVAFSQDLGWMLYDVFDLSKAQPVGTAKPSVSVFHAKIEKGILDVPFYGDVKVKKHVQPPTGGG
jgi:CRISPR-associated protein Cas5d